MGTQWKGDVKLRYERARDNAQKKVDDEAAAANKHSETTVVSTEESTDSTARTRLRRKTATLSPDGLKGVTHGVASSVLQA